MLSEVLVGRREMREGQRSERSEKADPAKEEKNAVAIYVCKHRLASKQPTPRWSSGYDSALSQPRAGFDSPSGKASKQLRVVLFAAPPLCSLSFPSLSLCSFRTPYGRRHREAADASSFSRVPLFFCFAFPFSPCHPSVLRSLTLSLTPARQSVQAWKGRGFC